MIAAAPHLLAAAAAVPWRPFLTAMPVWNAWVVLALPLCAGVAVVYKTTKCRTPATILRESLGLTCWITLGLIGAAIAVAIVVRLN